MSTTAPRTIRYIPKAVKLCLLTNSIRNFIDTNETRKEITIPTTSIQISRVVIARPAIMNFSIFKSDAPSIMGIAIKNENSALALRLTPESIPPIMVEPDLDVPGIRASVWKAPIPSE